MHRHPSMGYFVRRAVLGFVVLFFVLAPAVAGQDAPASRFDRQGARVIESLGQAPLSFERVGADHFGARGLGYQVLLTPTEVRLELSASNGARDVQLSFRFVGASAEASLLPEKKLPGRFHRYTGKDSTNWRTEIPVYSHVRGEQVYPGIDVVFYGNRGRLEYDFVVSPGARPDALELELAGADAAHVDGNGSLVVGAGGEVLRLPKPVIYQDHGGVRRDVRGGYHVLAANEEHVRVGFRIDAYDVSETLIIDPIVDYATYLGGSTFDESFPIAVDSAGNAYIAGSTAAVDYPTTPMAQQTTNAGAFDVFVTKLDAAGSFVYSTYIGGTDSDFVVKDIQVDDDGNAFLTGVTRSIDFPTVNAEQNMLGGGDDGFVFKLSPTGTLVYSTYIGGSGTELASTIEIDLFGNAYIAGITLSSNFPVVNAAYGTLGGGSDAFVAKLDPMGVRVYATYVGGSANDRLNDLAVDSAGNAHITAATFSTDFPLVNEVQSSLSGITDIYVTKLDTAGAVVYSTYLGGSEREDFPSIAVDDDHAYVVGPTSSPDFPVLNAMQPVHGGLQEGFVSKLDASGVIVYSTYLGGSSTENVSTVAVDSAGAAVIVGSTFSTDFPVLNAIQGTLNGFANGFVTKLDASGALAYSTYFGGNAGDQVIDVALDDADAAYLAGSTTSDSAFPILNAVQSSFGGASDVFVSKLTSAGALVYSTYYGGGGTDGPSALVVDSNGAAYLLGRTNTADFPVVNPAQLTFGGFVDAFVLKVSTIVDDNAQDIIDDVGNLVDVGTLSNGQGTSLINKIENALKQLDKGKVAEAIKKLEDLIDQVSSLIASGVLTPEEGQPLIDIANFIIAELGG